jgi:glycosyltransferase involved in cell wall biosynthesis
MPKVSVLVLTYNHAPFLRQTLDGALNQRTTFDYEVVVGDDCSTDGTQDIIREYQQRYPDRVVPVLHPKNLGGYGKNNTLKTLESCRGQYIAPLDGDDYWTSDKKLQKQVEYLDARPDFSACFHNALIKYDDLNLPEELVNPPSQKPVCTAEDLVGEDEVWFIATSAVLFRNGILRNYPRWFHESKSGDIPRYVLLAKHGPLGYLPEVLSVYRKNTRGMSFTDHRQDAEFVWNRIGMFKGIDAELGYRYHDKMRFALAKWYLLLAGTRQYADRPLKRAQFALHSLRLSHPNVAYHVKQVLLQHVIPDAFQHVYSRTKWSLERMLGRA